MLVSTDKAVHPATVMGASKALAEFAVEAASRAGPATRFATVRFGNVLGSSGSVVPIFRRQIQLGGPVTVTDARMTRYFMTIPEAVQLIIRSGSLGQGGEIFVLEMGEPVSIMQLARDMIELSGLAPGRDIAIEVVGRRPGEKLHEELFNPGERPQPTPAEKIMLADREPLDPEEVEGIFDEISLLVLEGDAAGLAAKVSDLSARRSGAPARVRRRRPERPRMAGFMTDAIPALSLSGEIEKYGGYAGFAAVIGLAVLALLYFAQAREVKRLREWAGRAPERAAELAARVHGRAQLPRGAGAAGRPAARRGRDARRPAGRRRRPRRARGPATARRPRRQRRPRTVAKPGRRRPRRRRQQRGGPAARARGSPRGRGARRGHGRAGGAAKPPRPRSRRRPGRPHRAGAAAGRWCERARRPRASRARLPPTVCRGGGRRPPAAARRRDDPPGADRRVRRPPRGSRRRGRCSGAPPPARPRPCARLPSASRRRAARGRPAAARTPGTAGRAGAIAATAAPCSASRVLVVAGVQLIGGGGDDNTRPPTASASAPPRRQRRQRRGGAAPRRRRS